MKASRINTLRIRIDRLQLLTAELEELYDRVVADDYDEARKRERKAAKKERAAQSKQQQATTGSTRLNSQPKEIRADRLVFAIEHPETRVVYYGHSTHLNPAQHLAHQIAIAKDISGEAARWSALRHAIVDTRYQGWQVQRLAVLPNATHHEAYQAVKQHVRNDNVHHVLNKRAAAK